MEAVLAHADHHLDHYTANNDIIDYIKDDERDNTSTNKNITIHDEKDNKNKDLSSPTGLFRAEVKEKIQQIDPFTGITVKTEQIKILGYYTTEDAAQLAMDEYNAIYHSSSNKLIKEDPIKYIDPMDPVLLKRDNEILKEKVFRRTTLLEKLRKAYLKDVVLIKEQLLTKEMAIQKLKDELINEKMLTKQLTKQKPEETILCEKTELKKKKKMKMSTTTSIGNTSKKECKSTASQTQANIKSIIDPKQKFLRPSNQLISLEGIEYKVLDRMLPSFDIRNSLPLFAPTETALLGITPCQFCGGTVDIACFDEIAVFELKKEFITLQNKYQKMTSDLLQAKEAVKHLQAVCADRIIQATDATELVSKLRLNITKLLNQNHENYITVHGRDKFIEKRNNELLMTINYKLEKKSKENNKLLKMLKENEYNIKCQYNNLSIEYKKYQKETNNDEMKYVKEITSQKTVIEQQTNTINTLNTELMNGKNTIFHLKENINILSQRNADTIDKYVKNENRLNTKLNALTKKTENLMFDKKTEIQRTNKKAGLSLMMKSMIKWGIRRNRRFFVEWKRYSYNKYIHTTRKQVKSLSYSLKHVKDMLHESRRRLVVEHALRVEVLAREGALTTKLLSKDDNIKRLQYLNTEDKRKLAILNIAKRSSKNYLHQTMKRKSIQTETILRFQVKTLQNIIQKILNELREKSIVLFCNVSINDGVYKATMKTDNIYKRKLSVIEKRKEMKLQIERKILNQGRERDKMKIEENQLTIHKKHSMWLISKWQIITIKLLLNIEKDNSFKYEMGWKKEKYLRDEDSELYNQKLKIKNSKITNLETRNNTLKSTICSNKEATISHLNVIGKYKNIELNLKNDIIQLKEDINDYKHLNDVVEVLSNRIIVERKYRNELFTQISLFIADTFMATTEDNDINDDDNDVNNDDELEVINGWVDDRQEKLKNEKLKKKKVNKLSLDRLSRKSRTLQQLPLWCKKYDGIKKDDNIKSDIDLLKNDLNRLSNVIWEQKNKIISLIEFRKTSLLSIDELENKKNSLETKLRRITLAMPTEKRRKLMKKKKREHHQKIIQSRSDATLKSIQMRVMSPDKFNNSLSPMMKNWKIGISPL